MPLVADLFLREQGCMTETLVYAKLSKFSVFIFFPEFSVYPKV